MKKLYFLFLLPFFGLNAQTAIEGTWKLAPQAGATWVGPDNGVTTWWANSLQDVTTRACLFDDSIKFDANGTLTHFMDGMTWVETWQGNNPEGCTAPVAPHDGVGPYTYAYDAVTGDLTLNGTGAHLGYAKVVNGGELSNTPPPPVPNAITYNLTFLNGGNTFKAAIQYGPGYWIFTYQKTVMVNPPTPNITFQVDMTNYTGPAFTSAYVNGNFNGWCGNCNAMTDANSDGIWDVTIPIGYGAIEYKFTLDGWNVQENFVGGEACTITSGGFTNRSYTVNGDYDLGAVCFESCLACASDVSFHVDMNDYTGPAYTGVYINGSFNGWNGTSNPMTDANSDGVWDITLPLPDGPVEYKFTLDGWAASEQFVGGEACTITSGGFTNRYLVVNGAANIDGVCYESCVACLAGLQDFNSDGILLSPNPASEIINVTSEKEMIRISIIDLNGKTVNHFSVSGVATSFSVANLDAGLYSVIIETETGLNTSKILVK